MTIQLSTLGGLRGSLDGAELDRLSSQELSAALLVYLAIERTATRDSLMALLWPEQGGETAGRRLSQMLYSLRQSLGANCVVARGRDVRAGECLQVDAFDFQRAIDEERPADAVGLYQGPFLNGVHLAATSGFQNWVDRIRARLARNFRRACRTLIEEQTAAGDLRAALATARTWAAPDPLDDEAQHQLIDLLARVGERSEALQHYASYEELLRRDDLEPLDETKELIRRVRESRPPPCINAGEAAPAEEDLDERVRRGIAPDLEVLRILGHGSTAAVYLAREAALSRLVAVKVLNPRFSADDVARQRFEREAQSAASIVHPNVAQIYRLSAIDGLLPYIVMEFVDGRGVSDVLAARGPFAPADARQLLRSIASALAAAHDHGIIHRDVSAANILIENRSGRPVLTDFGIAALHESGGRESSRLTPAGHRLGDVRYMSPEHARGESVTFLSDVYALGVVAFEMLTGEHPFRVPSPEQMIVAHLQHEPRSLQSLDPDIHDDLANVVQRCLAKQPERRPLAGEVAEMLAAAG